MQKTIKENIEIFNGLYIKWPDQENINYFDVFILRIKIFNYCSNAYKADFNKRIFSIKDGYAEILAWDIMINNLFFEVFFKDKGIIDFENDSYDNIKCNSVLNKLSETCQISSDEYYQNLPIKDEDIDAINFDNNSRFFTYSMIHVPMTPKY